jgi:hypothetical protein
MCKAKIRLGEARSIFLATSTNGMLFVFFYKKKKHGQPTTCWPGVGPGTFIVFFSLLMIFFAS